MRVPFAATGGHMIKRSLAAVLMPAMLGCTTFGPVNPKQYIVSHRPAEIWIWKADSSVVRMRGPHFLQDSDTLVGLVENAYQELPLGDIQQVKATRPAPTQTAALVIGTVALIGAAAIFIKKGPGVDSTPSGATPSNGGVPQDGSY